MHFALAGPAPVKLSGYLCPPSLSHSLWDSSLDSLSDASRDSQPE